MAEKFGFDFVEIDTNVSADTLLDYTHKAINTLYLIDLNEFEEKRQNQFLKFIEEPSKTVYVVLISNSDVGILNTIKNRCLRLYFEKYTKEELKDSSLFHTVIKIPMDIGYIERVKIMIESSNNTHTIDLHHIKNEGEYAYFEGDFELPTRAIYHYYFTFEANNHFYYY